MTNPTNDPAGYGSGGVSDVGDLPRIDAPTIEERHDAIDAIQGSLLSPVPQERTPAPETPELDKQSEIIHSGKAATVQDFYDWLTEEKHYVLARYVPEDERRGDDGIYGEQPVQVYIQPEQLMADFFGIDRDKIEAERRAILDHIRSQS